MEHYTNKKYWEDYSFFIKEVENLTGLSPANLLDRYEGLIKELNDEDDEYFIEWQYEFDNDMWTRRKIQMVLDFEPFSNNSLLPNFKEKVKNLDKDLSKHLLNADEKDCWTNPKLNFNRE